MVHKSSTHYQYENLVISSTYELAPMLHYISALEERIMYRVIINSKRTEAIIHFSDGRSVTLSDSQGNVLDLVVYMLSPMESQVETLAQYETAFGETQIIDLNKVS